jgi:hypothetical protein
MGNKIKPSIAAALLLISLPMFGHHGTGPSYDETKLLTLKGAITKFVWSNPHCIIFFDVKDDKGNVVNWAAEGNSPFNWTRQGWGRDTIKPGEEVTLHVFASRGGLNVALISDIVKASGEVVLRFGGGLRQPQQQQQEQR